MKRLFTTKFFIAVTFFCIGFLTNHFLTKLVAHPLIEVTKEEGNNLERFPVNPDDFDHKRILETIARMDDEAASGMGEIKRLEDDKNVYYHLPLKNQNGENHKLNVEIKNGMIKINEDVKSQGNSNFETSSERIFSIESNLDGDKAEVQNFKNEIVIKIPKK